MKKCADAPCAFGVWNGGERCISHAAKAGDATAKAELAARGERGRVARKARHDARKNEEANEVELGTQPGQLAALELAARMVVRSNEGACAKANALQRLVSTAAELVKMGDLEQRNKELEAMLVELRPELKKLRAV